MTWFRFDDNAVDHPKVASLSDSAFRWWVRGFSYASRFLTDGILPPIFWKRVHKTFRKELAEARLWDWKDPDFLIHDYVKYQSIKEDVEYEKERNREKAAAYRERRRAERRCVTGNVTGNVTGSASPPSTGNITGPENREQITENREQRTTKHGGGLILSPLQFARLQESHAFVGSILRVPNVLHSELRSKSGADADTKLQAWYLRLNEELELSGKGTGDVFAWLRPRHQVYALEQGWIEPAPKATAPKTPPIRTQDILDREAAKKAGQAS